MYSNQYHIDKILTKECVYKTDIINNNSFLIYILEWKLNLSNQITRFKSSLFFINVYPLTVCLIESSKKFNKAEALSFYLESLECWEFQ